jgi:DNA polymerase (family 10)
VNLREAWNLADVIKAELAPLCERIEIAGSIRRGRPEVNDIDFVILPKPGQKDAIKARCEKRCAVVKDGEQNYIVRLPESGKFRGFQIDIFFARPAVADLLQRKPGNFGTLFLCRTGSTAHNIWLVYYAKTRGMAWHPYEGVKDAEGYVIASETEEAIFDMLGLDFVPPAVRERP